MTEQQSLDRYHWENLDSLPRSLAPDLPTHFVRIPPTEVSTREAQVHDANSQIAMSSTPTASQLVTSEPSIALPSTTILLDAQTYQLASSISSDTGLSIEEVGRRALLLLAAAHQAKSSNNKVAIVDSGNNIVAEIKATRRSS